MEAQELLHVLGTGESGGRGKALCPFLKERTINMVKGGGRVSKVHRN